jgi:hypothetical protein
MRCWRQRAFGTTATTSSRCAGRACSCACACV